MDINYNDEKPYEEFKEYLKKTQKFLKDGEKFEINLETKNKSKNVVDLIEKLNKNLDNVSVKKVFVQYEKDYIDDEHDINQLKDLDKLLSELNIELDVKLKNQTNIESATLERTIVAQNMVDNFVARLNSTKIFDKKLKEERNLTTAEKFIVCYKVVADRFYNESKNFDNDMQRSWIGALTGDEIICTGYSSLLKYICNRVFDKKDLVCFNNNCLITIKDKIEAHENNIVRIKDERYGIDNLLYCDACWDSPKKINDKYLISRFNYCLLPLDKVNKIKSVDKIKFNSSLGANMEFLKDTTKFELYNNPYLLKNPIIEHIAKKDLNLNYTIPKDCAYDQMIEISKSLPEEKIKSKFNSLLKFDGISEELLKNSLIACSKIYQVPNENIKDVVEYNLRVNKQTQALNFEQDDNVIL